MNVSRTVVGEPRAQREATRVYGLADAEVAGLLNGLRAAAAE